MLDRAEKRLVLWWSVLIVLTLFSFEVAARALSARQAVTILIVIAFAKVKIVVAEFMEVRQAPLPLRLVLEAWTLTVAAVLAALLNGWCQAK